MKVQRKEALLLLHFNEIEDIRKDTGAWRSAEGVVVENVYMGEQVSGRWSEKVEVEEI